MEQKNLMSGFAVEANKVINQLATALVAEDKTQCKLEYEIFSLKFKVNATPVPTFQNWVATIDFGRVKTYWEYREKEAPEVAKCILDFLYKHAVEICLVNKNEIKESDLMDVWDMYHNPPRDGVYDYCWNDWTHVLSKIQWWCVAYVLRHAVAEEFGTPLNVLINEITNHFLPSAFEKREKVKERKQNGQLQPENYERFLKKMWLDE